jgi:hypothetical protein
MILLKFGVIAVDVFHHGPWPSRKHVTDVIIFCTSNIGDGICASSCTLNFVFFW